MKVAVSFSGLPRNVPRAIECWKNFIEKHNADVFVHMWNTNDNVISLLQCFSPISYFVEQPLNFIINDYQDRLINSNPYNVLSMWHSIYESMKLIKRTNMLYDIIVRARFDVEFDSNLELMSTADIIIPGKPAELYNYNGETYSGWHDMIAYGNIKGMSLYANTFNEISEIYNTGSPFFSEFFLSTNLHKHNANVVHQDVYANIAR